MSELISNTGRVFEISSLTGIGDLFMGSEFFFFLGKGVFQDIKLNFDTIRKRPACCAWDRKSIYLCCIAVVVFIYVISLHVPAARLSDEWLSSILIYRMLVFFVLVTVRHSLFFFYTHHNTLSSAKGVHLNV